ncbi:hypothetical protein BH10PSE7_BH10PSE7_00630 [soil metagenome]
MPFRHFAIVPFVTCCFLAGCGTHSALNNDRVINVETDAEPAGFTVSSSMAGLLTATSPSYVTLTVAEERSRGRSDATSPGIAVTSGSGFAVDSHGNVLTAAHVAVKDGYSVTARASDGQLYSGKVVAVRPNNDMALIHLSDFDGKPVKPASSTCLSPGATVFSLGKPHAQGDTARVGEVKAMSFGRAVSYSGYGYPDAMVLQMNTRKGESGGPVFNSSGELSGMVVSTLSTGNGQPLNLAHAIPAATIAQFLCSHSSCSARWQSLAGQSPKDCPAG